MTYRVVYGETRPAWEQMFTTKRKAVAFANKCEARGDVVYSVKPVVNGEPPQSIMAAAVPGYADEVRARIS